MPARLPPIRAVLFDLDDTLNDRALSWRAFVDWLARPDDGPLGPCDAAHVHAAILRADRGGYRAKAELFEALRVGLPWRSPLTAAAIEALWRGQFAQCIAVRAHAADALAALARRGVKIAVVTNGRVDAQQAKIDHMGLRHRLDAVVVSEAVGAKKPDARIFRAALDAIGVAPADAAFVGDNPDADIVGAAAAGLRTVWLANGRAWSDLIPAPDATIDSLADVDALVRRL